ncbi:MAG: hypothetical protein KGS60_18980 [Verrucomicrobia bacterium]|nr:hypothetical protein [Verrucomicrobiota bacterium]
MPRLQIFQNRRPGFSSWEMILPGLLACGSVFGQSMDTQPPISDVLEPVVVKGGYTTIDANTGAYNQPGWVQRRPFAMTRVHIQRNPGEVGVEHWVRARETDGEFKFRMQEEIEIGLPGRIQLDGYYDWTVEEGKAEHQDFAGEIRWAPADWGALWLNPALYLEYKVTDPSRGGDVIEPKILLGEDFGEGWHWGMNLIFERELSGEKAQEIAVTNAVSKTISEALSLGVEMAIKGETIDGARGEPETKVIIGPQMQWRPIDNMFINFVTLAGCTQYSPDFEGWFIVGYNFGSSISSSGSGGNSGGRRLGPISGRR